MVQSTAVASMESESGGSDLRRLFGRIRIAEDGGIFLADALAVLTAQTSTSAARWLSPPDSHITWLDSTGTHVLCWASDLSLAFKSRTPRTRSGRLVTPEAIDELSTALARAQDDSEWWEDELSQRAQTLAAVVTATVSMSSAGVPPSKRLKRGIRDLARGVEEAMGL